MVVFLRPLGLRLCLDLGLRGAPQALAHEDDGQNDDHTVHDQTVVTQESQSLSQNRDDECAQNRGKRLWSFGHHVSAFRAFDVLH